MMIFAIERKVIIVIYYIMISSVLSSLVNFLPFVL